MRRIDYFDDARLKLYFEEAIANNCQIEKRDGVTSLRFQDVISISVLPEPQTIDDLSVKLSKLASRDASDIDMLAHLMLEAAIIASHLDLRVLGPPAKSRQLGILRKKVSIDFALICSLSLAQVHGYSIRAEELQWEVMRSVLMVKDDDSLVRAFREFLSRTPEFDGPRYAIRNIRGADRVLSAESYWNLVSMAYVESWPDAVILRLIGEHLSLTLHPGFAHYSNTISGDEWRKMYERICELLRPA